MTPRGFDALVRAHAAAAPSRPALTVLRDGEDEEAVLTYGQLDRIARAQGARLRSRAAPGSRVVLLHPNGVDFVSALLGCAYAGMVAVPLSPPEAGHGRRRFEAVTADARPALVLLSAEIATALRGWPAPPLEAVPWVVTGDLDPEAADDWRDPGAGDDDPVVMQYTSGSTGDPRGVRVSRANLRTNLDEIARNFQTDAASVVVSWLPLFHDMGLVAMLLHALHVGGHCVLMTPTAFIQRPERWLRAITRYRATVSAAPDFAYARCARRIAEADRDGLDLHSWRVTLTGSEPVRAATLDEFAASFAPWGFRRETFYPGYGLAEATLMVTGGRLEDPPVVRWFATSALEIGTVEPMPARAPGSRAIVGCGRPLPGQGVEIVDPETGKPLGPGEVGEIWVTGPCVGTTAFDDQADPSFGARLAGTDEPYLRTGDLGFLLDEELFIVGRLKDLIIVHGRNLVPPDIEATVEACDPRVRPGAIAAFPIDVADAETVALACEIDVQDAGEAPALIAAIRGAVAAEHGVEVSLVALLAPRTLPRTTSGKLQRGLCRRLLRDGGLTPLTMWRAPEAPGPGPEAGPPVTLDEWLAGELQRRAGVLLAEIDPQRPVASYGLGSIGLAELVVAVEDRWQVRIPWTSLLESATLARLAAAVREGRGPAAAAARPRPSPTLLIPARENRLVLPAIRLGVRRLFRRHIHAVWVQSGYAPAPDRSTVYFLNHTSWWDFCLPILLDDRLFRQRARFMMDHGVMAHRWYFRLLFQRMGGFSIRQDDPALRHAALRYAFEFLQEAGRAFYLYPQGQLRPESAEIDFQDGVGWLSAHLPRTDFVPIVCSLHTLRTARPQLFLKVGEPVTIEPGVPIHDRTRLLEARCRELLGELQRDARDPFRRDRDKGFRRLR